MDGRPTPMPLPSKLLFIADGGLGRDLAIQVAEAVAAGTTFIEVRRGRSADSGSGPRLHEIRRCLAAAGTAQVIVNDRVDLALLSGAAGAHVGQDDLDARAARRLLGPRALLGLSTHDETQFAEAQELPLDYVALGPIFPSTTKSGHAEPLGLERLAACAGASRLPVVAIGGIDAGRLPSVLDAGASCVAVASAIGRGPVGERAREMLSGIRMHQPLQPPPLGAECVAIAGPPASGKTSVGPLVARALGLPFTDLDDAVGGPAGAAELLSRVGEDAFRSAEALALRRLLGGPQRVVALGGGTLLSGWSRLLLLRARARVVGLELDAAACARRLTAEAHRPLANLARARGPGALEEHVRLRLSAARTFPGIRIIPAESQPELVAERVVQALASGS